MDTLNLVLPLLIFLTFYVFIIRPQQKMRTEQEDFSKNLKKGMDVVTSSGIYGKINKIEGDVVHVQVDSKTFIKFTKSAISREMTQQAFSTNEKTATA